MLGLVDDIHLEQLVDAQRLVDGNRMRAAPLFPADRVPIVLQPMLDLREVLGLLRFWLFAPVFLRYVPPVFRVFCPLCKARTTPEMPYPDAMEFPVWERLRRTRWLGDKHPSGSSHSSSCNPQIRQMVGDTVLASTRPIPILQNTNTKTTNRLSRAASTGRARGPHNPMTLDCIKQRIFAAERAAYRQQNPITPVEGGSHE